MKPKIEFDGKLWILTYQTTDKYNFEIIRKKRIVHVERQTWKDALYRLELLYNIGLIQL